ncbi:hypothetical protein WBJ53_06035 [Spirosoma sp. SC4-14]|uniref:hypothetical protein n=1 Tax=Spirosoma sp. SC4-14 TaxID=3128900 RepID=UPI0030CF2AF3
MKTIRVTLLLSILLSLSVSGFFTRYTGANEVMAMSSVPANYYNPLLLNNRSLDYNLFSIGSKGVLSVVAGNPIDRTTPRIPFRIYLQRNGKAVRMGASDSSQVVSQIDVSAVLIQAKPGDILVIEPARSEEPIGRQTIRLKDTTFNLQFNLFPFLKQQKDNC